MLGSILITHFEVGFGRKMERIHHKKLKQIVFTQPGHIGVI
jgi:hypothetical protein